MTETKAPPPTSTPPTPAKIAADGSPAALRSGALGGITISWDKLLTTVPIYIGLIVIWLYFDSQTNGLFIGAILAISDILKNTPMK